MSLPELLEAYKAGTITFDEVLHALPGMEWAVQLDDGERVWWSNRNTSSVVDLAFMEGVITDKERTSILSYM